MQEAHTDIKSGFYVRSSEGSESIEIIDNFEMTNEFKQFVCLPYFKDVFKDLSSRSDEPDKGITKLLFLNYVNLPGIIGERLFAIFDINRDGYLDLTEFATNLFKLYSTDFNIKLKLVFDLYDFDKDGEISKEDVQLLLSHVPIQKVEMEKSALHEGLFTRGGGGGEEYMDRAESQKELTSLIDICFETASKLTFEDFKRVTEKVSSEMFLCMFSLLKTHFPSINQFKRYEQGLKKKPESLLRSPAAKRKLASPKVLSKFSPLSHIVKFSTPKTEKDAIIRVHKMSTAELEEIKTPSPVKSKFAPKEDLSFVPVPAETEPETPVESGASSPIVDAVRHSNPIIEWSPTNKQSTGTALFCECGKAIVCYDKLLCVDCLAQLNDSKCEGYLLKSCKSGIKKYWVCIEKRELFCYASKELPAHKKMYNLIGCFIKEGLPEKLEDTTAYPFTLIFSAKKAERFYVTVKEEYDKWVAYIKKAVGYANLLDYYDLKENLGKGKFGKVRGGIHKKTGKRVAIKIMKKSNMCQQDIELIKQEIEILKVCQHPNIIRMYDVFENVDYIYIVMELLKGGDLFSYLEKRKFKISEYRAACISHSLAAALYYLHSYGIIHRDLKPENVLMVDKSEKSDVKIVDFGLSKLVGPEQLCTEPFGTLSYVAPEVLLEKPYSKGVDVWSLGVITHLMLVGCLPFDHEDDHEVAQYKIINLQYNRQTIRMEPDYESEVWENISKEGLDFVKRLLIKDSNKRMTLKEVLQHPWITRDIKDVREARRNSLPGEAFSLYSLVKPEGKDLLKEIQKKKLGEL